ncbi:type II toxin-antitoxin system HipA family toxin YjjJ [Jeongeupia sp. HS-3]|uniref:type II toxin-antitoxin system HipA family toxin YjjJ n=1 Tax=Jeongeupia sp. HS-3 TaxID=1009682 RepID=UPI0019106035|nr:type II toxin-antitoxin system HipA family toxin YjjJ [Jeongeupia sp. HS-3]
MAQHPETVRQLLGQGPQTSRQLVDTAGISQPTVSRALATLGHEVVRIGVGSAIQYALRDSSRGFASAPIFRVSEEGQIRELGVLVPVRPDGFVMVQADGVARHSDGLPWWLFDMRPQGYLGRAYASTHAAGLGLPANPEHWSDPDVIRALLAQGHDAIGNLLVGEVARARFMDMPAPTPADREVDYPALALAAGAGEVAGSSAGGEQPKFCTYTARGHVLVKFSAPNDNPVSERWRDLLLAEHQALSVLGVETEVFDFGGQRFLEVPRFDRVGPLGRIGVVSLRALDAEFVGDASAAWPSLVSRLAVDGNVGADAVNGAARLWAFGTLIGNTDMHAGNLSFIGSHGRPYQLAPAYDVLPMGFAPRSSGAIGDTLPPASLSAVVDGETWREALHLAERFLGLVGECDGFSGSFSPCIEALRRHIEEAASRIARLG